MVAGTVTDLKPKSRTNRYGIILALVALALLAGWLLGGGKKVKQEVAYVAGMEEYVYGYPLVMMDVTRQLAVEPGAGARGGLAQRRLPAGLHLWFS
jgi:hypothetical protein